ncbi:hypothetical protein DFH07DRAFT_994850 [Mycena maculata]|uniref:Uncharacterized protein n=1 Tax=Mycena maculata TaxID=230809 RepID=A0AAD7HW88_9AGAR|nr:hypothetical protein DFH07DRAFT_994850 [Mycena maculata]
MPLQIVGRSRLFILILSLSTFGLFYSKYYLQNVPDPVLADNTAAIPSTPSSIPLVSAFFPLSKSKHTMREYEWWLCQFLQPITTDIYFYTSAEMVPVVRKCRGSLHITIDITFSTPFDIPPLRDLEEEYQKMYTLDREKDLHSSALWNGKPFFLDEAVKTLSRQGRNYDYAFWNDAGSFRSTHNFTDWPSLTQGSALTGQKQEDLLFCRVPHPSHRYWQEDMGPIDNYFSEASFFGGSPQTVSWWRATYYAYHDHYLRQGHFVGKDQNLIHALFLLFPSRVIGVWLDDPDAPAHKALLPLENKDEGFLGTCGENWFYYQFWLASAPARESMHKIWESAARWTWGWWRQRHECL